jgi:hypothetical protein
LGTFLGNFSRLSANPHVGRHKVLPPVKIFVGSADENRVWRGSESVPVAQEVVVKQYVQGDPREAAALVRKNGFGGKHVRVLVGKRVDGPMKFQSCPDLFRQCVRLEAAREIAQQITDSGFHGWRREKQMREMIQGNSLPFFIRVSILTSCESTLPVVPA